MGLEFNGYCLIFFAVWYFCLCFAIGLDFYHDKFTPRLAVFENVHSSFIILAYANVVLSFVGLMFIICSIVHVIPAILFLFTLLLLNIPLCAIGFGNVHEIHTPSPNIMLNHTRDQMNDPQHRPIHFWLEHTQLYNDCCGVISYLDYPIHFYQEGYNNLSKVISSTCCKIKTKECLSALNTNITAVIESEPIVTNSSENIYSGLNCSYNTTVYANKPNITQPANIRDIISTCGCYQRLHDNMSSLSEHYLAFFVAIFIFTIIMVSIYIKNWLYVTRNLHKDRLAKEKESKSTVSQIRRVTIADLTAPQLPKKRSVVQPSMMTMRGNARYRNR